MTKSVSKNSEYVSFLTTIKSRIQSARIKAARSVNNEMISLYWSIGKDIVEKQEKLGWGKSVVEKLSRDLCKSFSGTHGFSTQNLCYMRQFYLEYRSHSKLQQLAGEITWFIKLLERKISRSAWEFETEPTHD